MSIFIEHLENLVATDKFQDAIQKLLTTLGRCKKEYPQAADDVKELRMQTIVLSSQFQQLNKPSAISLDPNIGAKLAQLTYTFLELLGSISNFSDFSEYLSKKIDNEVLWEETKQLNEIFAYKNYINLFPRDANVAAANSAIQTIQASGKEHIEPITTNNSQPFDIDALFDWWDNLAEEWKKIFLKTINHKRGKIKTGTIRKIALIERIDLGGNRKITNLEALQVLKNLKRLNSSNTNISDFEPLRSLKKLNVIWAIKTKTTDLTPLADLEDLQMLDISSTTIELLEPLFGRNNLLQLICIDTKISQEQKNKFRNSTPNCHLEDK